MSVAMLVLDLKGHEETKFEHGALTPAWIDVYAQRRVKIETEPQVLIVGAGQAGLMLAAACKQLDVRALVIERHARVGDIWRDRYPTLALHTPRCVHEMLYQPYPSNWPIFASKDQFADWLEGYAKSQGLVVWTNSRIDGRPVYNDETKSWSVTILRNEQKITLQLPHIVLASGNLGEPRIPSLPGRELFKGKVLHGEHYRGGPSYIGQRIIVVGACNTAIDICQDLCYHNVGSVTMIQRSSTCVVSGEKAASQMQRVWKDGVPAEVGDFKFRTLPLGLQKKIQQMRTNEMWEEGKEMFDKLRKGGVKLNMGPEGAGQALMVWDRSGGYWLDKGGADLIAAGDIQIKQGHEAVAFTETGLKFADGTELEADAVIFATGYISIRETSKKTFGAETIERTGEVYGLDDEGEIKGIYRPSGHPGLWYACGTITTARTMAKQLALQLKAVEIGLMTM